MNGRKLFRNYARTKGKEAHSFVEIKDQMYQQDTLITKTKSGDIEETRIDYKEVVHLIIQSKI